MGELKWRIPGTYPSSSQYSWEFRNLLADGLNSWSAFESDFNSRAYLSLRVAGVAAGILRCG